jgi:hypothetical protein
MIVVGHAFRVSIIMFYLQENNETEDETRMTDLRTEKVPKRILHFSDGTIEEYSSDDDEPDTSGQLTAEVQSVILCLV